MPGEQLSEKEQIKKFLVEEFLEGKGITKRTSVRDQTYLDRFKSVEYYMDQLYRCAKCGTCRTVYQEADYSRICPSGELRKFESYYLGGKNLLLWGLMTGKIEWSQPLAEILYHCTLCGNCAQQCQIPELHHYALEWLAAVREEAVKVGFGPMPEQKRFAEHVEREYNPYMELHKDRLNWLIPDERKKLPKTAETVYFVGCTSAYREKEIAKATFEVLCHLGIDFTIMKDERCCGSPLVWTGQAEQAEECAKNAVEELNEVGAEKVITSCAGCYRMLKEVYKEKFKIDHGLEVIHSPVFLLEQVKDGKLKLLKEIKRKMTYHDPCHIGRHMGIYEQPRALLQRIPGVKLFEMERNRQNAWCCGSGSGVKSAFKDLALFAGYERLKEAEETGASTLVSSCPFCERNFKDTADHYKINLEIKDVVELIRTSMAK